MGFTCGGQCWWWLDIDCYTTPSELTRCEVLFEVSCPIGDSASVVHFLCSDTTEIKLPPCQARVKPTSPHTWGTVSNATHVTFQAN
jgi:hypothetical protein